MMCQLMSPPCLLTSGDQNPAFQRLGSSFLVLLVSTTLSAHLHCREEACKKLNASSRSALLALLHWVVDGLLYVSIVEAELQACQPVVVVSSHQASASGRQPSQQRNRCKAGPTHSSTGSQPSSSHRSQEQAQATLRSSQFFCLGRKDRHQDRLDQRMGNCSSSQSGK